MDLASEDVERAIEAGWGGDRVPPLDELFDDASARFEDELWSAIVRQYGQRRFDLVDCSPADYGPFDTAIYWMQDGARRYYLASEMLCQLRGLVGPHVLETKKLLALLHDLAST